MDQINDMSFILEFIMKNWIDWRLFVNLENRILLTETITWLSSHRLLVLPCPHPGSRPFPDAWNWPNATCRRTNPGRHRHRSLSTPCWMTQCEPPASRFLFLKQLNIGGKGQSPTKKGGLQPSANILEYLPICRNLEHAWKNYWQGCFWAPS